MGRETQQGLGSFLVDQQDGDAGEESLRARLAGLERAYQDLLERLRRYERERGEIKSRLEGILARLGTLGTP
jgi:uncharacterized protein YhaN